MMASHPDIQLDECDSDIDIDIDLSQIILFLLMQLKALKERSRT